MQSPSQSPLQSCHKRILGSEMLRGVPQGVDQLLMLGMVIPPLMGNPYDVYKYIYMYINLSYTVDDHLYHKTTRGV